MEGPGCSSLMGLLYEIGPFSIDKSGNAIPNNLTSWTNDYALLFVDQPVGTGLSYGREKTEQNKRLLKKKKGSNVVSNEEEAAYDLGLALSFFFKKHPELNGEAIYLATEVLFLFRFLIDGLLIGTIQSHTVARFVCLLFVFSHSVLTMMVFSTLRSSP